MKDSADAYSGLLANLTVDPPLKQCTGSHPWLGGFCWTKIVLEDKSRQQEIDHARLIERFGGYSFGAWRVA